MQVCSHQTRFSMQDEVGLESCAAHREGGQPHLHASASVSSSIRLGHFLTSQVPTTPCCHTHKPTHTPLLYKCRICGVAIQTSHFDRSYQLSANIFISRLHPRIHNQQPRPDSAIHAIADHTSLRPTPLSRLSFSLAAWPDRCTYAGGFTCSDRLVGWAFRALPADRCWLMVTGNVAGSTAIRFQRFCGLYAARLRWVKYVFGRCLTVRDEDLVGMHNHVANQTSLAI